MTKQSLKKGNFALVLVGGEKRGTVLPALKNVGWCEFRVDEFLKRFPEENLLKWFSSPFPSSPLRGEGCRCDEQRAPFGTPAESMRRVTEARKGKTGEGDKSSLSLIGTVRGDKEHQESGLHISEEKRLEVYKKIVDCVDYVDVEIKSSIAEEVANYTRKKKKKIIASYHNFSKTPSRKGLGKIYRQGIKLNPDILKIATNVCSEEDMLALLSFTHRYSDKIPLVVIPMGVPAVERLMPIYFGSLFTYVSLDKQTAPGQISYRKIACLLDD